MVAEMRMIRWLYGYTRMNRIRNDVITDIVKVTPIKDKMKETKLRWCGHVKSGMDATVRRRERTNIPKGKTVRGRPKKSLDEVIRKDLKVVGLTEDMALDRRLWQDRIQVLDHIKMAS